MVKRKGYRVLWWDKKYKEWVGQGFAMPTRAKAERMAKSLKEQKTKIEVTTRYPVEDVLPDIKTEYGRETADLNYKKFTKKKCLLILKKMTLASSHEKPINKMTRDEKGFLREYRNRLCELLKVKKEDYKLYWEK